MEKYLKADDEIRRFETKDELWDYLEFRKEHDEWYTCFINELSAVGIPDEPLFIPKYCTDITVQKNGYTQELPDIDFEQPENEECIHSTGIFLAFPCKNKLRILPTREIAYPTVLKRAADDCGTMIRTEPKPNKGILPVNERADRLTRDFLLYSDACKILYRDGKISAVLSKGYAVLPADELVMALEVQLEYDHPDFTFDRGEASHEFVVAEYLLNDREMEESFRLALNDAGAGIRELKAGIRFSTSDIGLGKASASLFYDADNVRTVLSGQIELVHDGDATPEKFGDMLEGLGMLFKESEEQIENLGNTDIKDVAGTVGKITERYGFFPRNIVEEVEAELKLSYPDGGTAIDVYLALNDIIQRHKAKSNLSPTRYLNLCEQVAKLMHLPYDKIDAGEDWK